MPTNLRDADALVGLIAQPHSEEELRIADGDPGVRDLVREYPLRRWLTWMLSLWGERLPVGKLDDAAEVKDEVLAWCWWWTRLSLADVFAATRLAFGTMAPKLLPSTYGIAREHMRAWLDHLAGLSPATLYQAVLLGRELADPWASALRDAQHAWGLRYRSMGLLVCPGFNLPRPPNPHPTAETSYWEDLLDGAKEFASMSWKTLQVASQYWANRAYDVDQVLEPRETLFDYQYVERWGAEGEKQLAGRVADVRNLLIMIPNETFVAIGGKPPFPHSPTYTADMFLPGVRDWMGRVGDYSIRNGAWLREQGVLGPRWALAPDTADAEEVWLQGLILSGGMYTASASLPRLFGTARTTAIVRAPELTSAAALIGALYGVEGAALPTGVKYIARTDAAGRTWIQAVRSSAGGAWGFFTAPFRAMRDWWRYRKGGRVEWETLIKESEPGLREIRHSVLANEAATKAGIPGQVSQAIARSLDTASSPAGRAAQDAVGTVINVGNTAAGLPLVGPGAGPAGAVQGAIGTVQQLGNAAMTERGLRVLKLAGGASAIAGTVPFSAFLLEESSQSVGMASYQAARSKNPDLVQEATRRMDSIARTARGPAVWVPGWNLYVAFSEFFAATHFSADVFRETAGQVRNLNGVGRPEKPGAREPIRPEPTGPGQVPGGKAVVPPPPKAPAAPSKSSRAVPMPISMEERRAIALIEADNRETLLLEEYAEFFKNGSRLLWDDTGFVWPARARAQGFTGRPGIENTGPAVRVYLLADGRIILRLPLEHALFGPIRDRMRRLKARKAAVFLPGLSDATRTTGIWIIQPEVHGLIGEILLNTNDVPVDQLTETEKDLTRQVTDTDVDGEDFPIPSAPPRRE